MICYSSYIIYSIVANYGQESSQSNRSHEGLPAKSDKPHRHRHRFVKAINQTHKN
jgi:hypothetical protein